MTKQTCRAALFIWAAILCTGVLVEASADRQLGLIASLAAIA